MNEREKNDLRCRHLLNRLVSLLGIDFKPATGDLEDGWYVWRNSPDWPIDEYAVFELADGKTLEPVPVDSDGAVSEICEFDPSGELAGPIIGR